MRSLLWMLVFAGIVAVGYGYWAETQRLASAGKSERAAIGQADLGLRRMLLGHGGYAFADLVIGVKSGIDRFDFRGRVSRDGRSMPAYGQAQRLCEYGLEAADCWRIVMLEIDGLAEEIAEAPVRLANAKSGTGQGPTPAGSALETADTVAQTGAPLPSVKPAFASTVADPVPKAEGLDVSPAETDNSPPSVPIPVPRPIRQVVLGYREGER